MRQAIAMIELIFAIVVMGIVMLSAPMLISTASKSGYVAIQQEGINEAASQLNMILGYQWDENNTNEAFDPVILSAAGDTGLDEVGTTGVRAGTPLESFRKFVASGVSSRGVAIAVASLGADTGDQDDMDDFDATVVNLNPEELGGDADYIEKGTDINISRSVAYMSDAPNAGEAYIDGGGSTTSTSALSFLPSFTDAANTTNIKRIQVTLTSASGVDELEKTITLHAFSCNIGSYTLEER